MAKSPSPVSPPTKPKPTAAKAKSDAKPVQTRIADNKKAAFNYFFEERFECGMVLEGWEVKSLRAGKVQLTDGYVVIRNGELYLIGCQINPMHTASTHVNPDNVRTKKLLPVCNRCLLGHTQGCRWRVYLLQIGVETFREISGAFVVNVPQTDHQGARPRTQKAPGQPDHLVAAPHPALRSPVATR